MVEKFIGGNEIRDIHFVVQWLTQGYSGYSKVMIQNVNYFILEP